MPHPKVRVIGLAIQRLRGAWRNLPLTLEAEYRSALDRIDDLDAISWAVEQVIITHEDRWPPPVAMLMRLARQQQDRLTVRRETRNDEVQFLQAAPDPRDPPGVIRWIAVQPDGARIPAGAVAIDDVR